MWSTRTRAGANRGTAERIGDFTTPVAAVLIAVELLLFEWKPRSFIPVAVASAVAAGPRPLFFDAGALFPVASHPPLPGGGLIAAVAVGLVAGFASCAMTTLVYGSRTSSRSCPSTGCGGPPSAAWRSAPAASSSLGPWVSATTTSGPCWPVARSAPPSSPSSW